MDLHRIKLKPRDDTGQLWVVELDGVDISRYVQRVNLDLTAGETPMVTLTFIGEIELPVVEAYVQAAKGTE